MSRFLSKRKRRFLKLALALTTTVALVSCWVPVYDPAASLSAKLEAKLFSIGSFGPIEIPDEGDYSHFFVPEKILYPSVGYWTRIRVGDSQAYVFNISNISTYLPGPYYSGPKETLASMCPCASPASSLASIGAVTVVRDKLKTYIESSTGDLIASIPTGSFLLSYEAEDLSAVPPIWYTYFSRSTVLRRKDAPDQLFIDVFRYPTAKLADLAE